MANYVQYKTKRGQDKVINGTTGNGELRTIIGPVSSTILENAKQGNVVLIFGQGDLNLTPLILSLFLGDQSEGDVLIGIPSNKYSRLNSQYYNDFFSLISGNSRFFYKNTLWCSARSKKDSNEGGELLFELDNIEFRPKWGLGSYKKDMESRIREELQSGNINRRSFVVTFPLNIGFAHVNLDNSVLTFANEKHPLRPISPKLIILESVNETMHNLEPLVPLISNLLENDTGAVIHFSWPYVNGLSRFISALDKMIADYGDNLKLFHFGKRFSFDLKNYVVNEILEATREPSMPTAMRDHPAIENLSLEGRNWESYYADRNMVNSKNIEFCAPLNGLNDFQRITQVLSEKTTTDHRIDELKESLSNITLQDGWWFFCRFMPFIDSFVPPASLSYTFRFEDGSYRSLGIIHAMDEAGKRLKDSDLPTFESLSYMIKAMSETFNLLDYLNELKTPYMKTKYSSLFSFLLKSLFEVETSNIVICDFNPRFGFKNYTSSYLNDLFQYIEEHCPFSYDSLPVGDFIVFSPNGDVLRSVATLGSIIKIDIEKNPSGKLFEVKMSIKKNHEMNTFQKKVSISLASIDELYRNITGYDYKDTTLLLPGPLPLLRFDTEFPILSEGVDLFLRPFKKIVIFVNPGENFVRAREQVATITSFLYEDKGNAITAKDLLISRKLNNSHKLSDRIDLLLQKQSLLRKANSIEKPTEDKPDFEETLEDAIRDEFIENESKIDPEGYKSLRDIWSSISKNKTRVTSTTSGYDNAEEFLLIRVIYDRSNTVEDIPIRKGSYVRLVDDEDSESVLVEKLQSGQKIAYLKSDTRESIDNFFIRNYSDYSGITVEQVYEPFRCLEIFYATLSSVNFLKDYTKSDFENLYWLSETERYQVYEDIKFLMQIEKTENFSLEVFREHFRNSVNWNALSLQTDDVLVRLKKAFTSTPTVSLKNLYELAVAFGLIYDFNSFKLLVSTLSSGQNKYFFLDENNLLVLARLLNYARVQNNYEDLTDAGKNIRTVLQLVGKSLRRVMSGRTRYLSDMDILIEQKVMICTIL